MINLRELFRARGYTTSTSGDRPLIILDPADRFKRGAYPLVALTGTQLDHIENTAVDESHAISMALDFAKKKGELAGGLPDPIEEKIRNILADLKPMIEEMVTEAVAKRLATQEAPAKKPVRRPRKKVD